MCNGHFLTGYSEVHSRSVRLGSRLIKNNPPGHQLIPGAARTRSCQERRTAALHVKLTS